MSDLRKYVARRKRKDPSFAEGFDEGYEEFKIGVILRHERESAGLTQEQVAVRLKTNKSAISRIENHAEDIKLSTLKKFANAIGKQIRVEVTGSA
jgi:ribosome-binding protein aMBF1 (putative translation factor)